MTNISLLFPETSNVLLTYNHFLFLDKLISLNTIPQKNLQKKTGLNKSIISKIKADFIKLGWCKDINYGLGREIQIKINKNEEIKSFLAYWKFLKHTIPVRPHNIKFRCLFKERPQDMEKALNSFTKDYKTVISGITNNKEYLISTKYGKIMFFLKGMLIQFWIEGFIVPVSKKDIDSFGDYIRDEIIRRVLYLHEIVKEHLKKFKIEIYDYLSMENLHIGILTKKNVSAVLGLRNRIKELKMFTDNSIYGCCEIEKIGDLNQTINCATNILNKLFDENSDKQSIEGDCFI